MNVYIWTDYEWQPWANTKFYYPLTDDQLDKVWWTSIPITWTKETLWYTFNFTWSDATALNNSNLGVRFISYWANFHYSNSTGASIFSQAVATNYAEVMYQFNHNTPTSAARTFQRRTGSASWSQSAQQNTSANTWYHLAYWFDWTKLYWYINWVKVWEQTPSSTYDDTSVLFGRLMNITYSEVIWESVVRTADKVLSYYNQTKSNYWIQ